MSIRIKLRYGAQHTAIHQPKDRNEHRALKLNTTNNKNKKQARGKAENQRKDHFTTCTGIRKHGERDQNTKFGSIQTT